MYFTAFIMKLIQSFCGASELNFNIVTSKYLNVEPITYKFLLIICKYIIKCMLEAFKRLSI